MQESGVIAPLKSSTNAAGPAAADARGNAFAYTLLLIGPVLFVTNMLAAKATADLMPPVALAFFRWAGAFALVAPIALPRLWARRRAVRAEAVDLLVLGALGMGVCGAFVYIGADTTTATNIGLIYSSSPVLIILLAAVFFGQRTSRRSLIGVAMALLGVLLIIARGDPDVLIKVRFVVGDLWILAAAAGWAVYSVLLKHRRSSLDTLTRFFAICLAGVLILAPFAMAEHLLGEHLVWTWKTIGWIALVATVPGIGAYVVYAFIVDRLGPHRAGFILYLIPPYNAVMAWLLLDETPMWYHLLGGVFVLGGIWLASVNLAGRSMEGQAR